MNWKQHMIVAVIFSLAILFTFFGVRDYVLLAILALFAALSSLIPDLDHKMSKGTELVNKAVIILSLVISEKQICGSELACLSDFEKIKSIMVFALAFLGGYFIVSNFMRPKHRGITHSFLFTLVYTAIVYLVLGIHFAIAGFIGYGSHLLADREIKLV